MPDGVFLSRISVNASSQSTEDQSGGNVIDPSDTDHEDICGSRKRAFSVSSPAETMNSQVPLSNMVDGENRYALKRYADILGKHAHGIDSVAESK